MAGAHLCLPAVLPLLFISCATTGGTWASRVEWNDLSPASLPSASQYPDDGAVIVLDEGTMEVLGTVELGFSSFETHRIVKVFDARGERFANVVVSYSEGSSVEDIQARTIAPSGKISVLSPEAVYDASLYPNFVFFSDRRAKLFTLPAVEPGAILEYRYRIVIGYRTLWHSWTFQNEVRWASGGYVWDDWMFPPVIVNLPGIADPHAPAGQALVNVVRSDHFKEAVLALGGYDTGETGQATWIS